MNAPSFKEDHISQIPALQLLMKLGYTYLSPIQADELRGNKTSNVIFDDILRERLKAINTIQVSSSKSASFSDENIERGILALKNLPMNEGYIPASQKVYNLLTLGTSLEQIVDGDKKSFTLQYIDWKNIHNNVFHVTEEFSVVRSTSKDHYRPDIVLFINGIPLCIIECKRPDMKEPLKQAISQQTRNQQEDGIRSLYAYSQLVLSIATQEASYATTGTPEKFWAKWREDEKFPACPISLEEFKNQPLSNQQRDALFSGRFNYVRQHFDLLDAKEVKVTEQDRYLYNLCLPERMMDLIFNFILYDNSIKKIARYQQFYAVKKSLQKLQHIEGGKRKGGVIWHTQGSGKSLTMVMLAQAIVMAPGVKNPKIILVTDRTDLDEQITGTFRKCGKTVDNASTGQKLVELLESPSDAVITTIINKFNAAVKKIKKPLTSPDIFVLIDEGHRTQYGTFNVDMERTLPNACFIALTGTPLFKKDKNTANKFGGITDAYTVDQAVKDGAVVPLLYEGRMAIQQVDENPLDNFFGMVSEPLSDYEKTDIKKKFARYDHLNSAEQKMHMIAFDISRHFRDNFQERTPFKGQLVCDKKINAIKYKQLLDEIGIVSSEVIISSIDEREGEDSAFEKSHKLVNQFWRKMMDQYGTAKNYEESIINRFKNQDEPEIIIVVDKLLTGFDAPKNTVLYLTRNLSEHKLLQAIARVNRVHEDKDFGYVIDYYGVLGNLDDALLLYANFNEFDENDLTGTMMDISEEIKQLPQKHANVWELFKTIPNKRDAEAYQEILKDEAIREEFYEKLSVFAKSLKVALSSVQFYELENTASIDRYKDDLLMFMKLRKAVIERYSDEVDYSKYEGQIQKLIDRHVTTERIEVITELVNIFDKEKFQEEINNTVGTKAKADKIASRTAKHISEKMDGDPAFYKKFSQLLQETIADYEAKRISELQYLERVTELMENVLSYTDADTPTELEKQGIAKALYGSTMDGLKDLVADQQLLRSIAIDAGLEINRIIEKTIVENEKVIIDWQFKTNITGKLLIDIGDYLIDEVKDKYDIALSYEKVDEVANKCIDIAKNRIK